MRNALITLVGLVGILSATSAFAGPHDGNRGHRDSARGNYASHSVSHQPRSRNHRASEARKSRTTSAHVTVRTRSSGQVRRHAAWNPNYRPTSRPGYVWQAGYRYQGSWMPGYWRPVRMRSGYEWVPGFWTYDGYVEGYWRATQRVGYVWVGGYYDAYGMWIDGYWRRVRR